MDIKTYNSLHEASKDTGISLNALWNAREKGNRLVVRRRDKVPFQISWSDIHFNCFEKRREERAESERRERLEKSIE